MKIGMIGLGAIGSYVRDGLQDRGHALAALLVRPERASKGPAEGVIRVASVADLPAELDLVIDCAGHAALRTFGPDILRSGVSLITVSIGALADQALYEQLMTAARDGKSRLHLASGAIGALDCLRAARAGGLDQVTYVGRKPPQGWKGSPAEDRLDLEALEEASDHFDGWARDAATRYPKNANVAAAVALAGTGFDATRVRLVADPDIQENIHEIHAEGAFGRFAFEVRGRSLPDNPRSSALAAMSVLSALEQETNPIHF